MLSVTTLFPSDPPDDDDDDDVVDDEHAVDPRQAALRDMLLARLPRVIVTPAILVVIAAVFVAMVVTSAELSFSSTTLLAWGAQSGPRIALGEWWRLLTAMWLHAGPLHIGFNALFLWRFGAYVERLLGPVVFLIVYVLAGAIASVVSVQFQASNGLSIGASGALFGLVGVLLMVAMTSGGRGGLGDMLAELRQNLVSVVVANLMLGFLMPGIDNAAHLGGLAGGLVLGWLVGRHSLDAMPPLRVTVIPIVVTAALVVAASMALASREDARIEVARFGTRIERAEADYAKARADLAAGRRAAGDVVGDVERRVLPFVHEAQRRAEKLAPGSFDARRAVTTELAWKLCLEEYERGWQLRLAGLRAGDAARVADGDARADRALNVLSRVLARQ